MRNDDFEIDDDNAIVCPYCKARNEDAWECNADSDDEQKCWECDKIFSWRRNVSVNYVSKADCKLNKEEHDFDTSDNWIKNDKSPNEEFRICNCKKCAEYEVERRTTN